MGLLWFVLAILGGGLALLVLNHDAGSIAGIRNDDFAHILFFGTIALVMGAGLFASRIPLNETLRNIAIWLCLLFVLVAGYQFRYELQDVASRVSAGLVPGSPVSSFDAEGRASVMLDRGGDGHFAVNATIDGARILFLLDTGASTTVLTEADAERAGIDTAKLSFSIPVSTANGVTEAARAVVGEVAVGGIERHNMPVLVARAGSLDQSLLGMSFIGTLSGFDMRGERQTLRD